MKYKKIYLRDKNKLIELQKLILMYSFEIKIHF